MTDHPTPQTTMEKVKWLLEPPNTPLGVVKKKRVMEKSTKDILQLCEWQAKRIEQLEGTCEKIRDYKWQSMCDNSAKRFAEEALTNKPPYPLKNAD